jgi:hypothetical protein
MPLRWNDEKGTLEACKPEYADDLPGIAGECTSDAVLIALMLGRVADELGRLTEEIEKLGSAP